MNNIRCVKQLALASVLAVPGVLSAAVVLPALDIQDIGSDTGAAVTTSSFSVDATAFTIITSSGALDIPDEAFTLTSTSGSYDPAADGGLGFGTFGGTFTVNGGLLSGAFTGLQVFGFGDDINYDFSSDVTFNSGSLMGGFTSGRIEGSISDSVFIAKLGTVAPVPVPAAVWLFGSGLLALTGVARRKSVQ